MEHSGRMIGNDLIVTTRRHTCCECRTMATPLRQEKKSPNCSSPSVISSLGQGWAIVSNRFASFCFSPFSCAPELVIARTPKNGWTMTFMAVTSRCNNDPLFPRVPREEERACVISIGWGGGGGEGIYSIALNATPSAFNRRLYSLHVTFLLTIKSMKIFFFFFFLFHDLLNFDA